MSRFIAPGGVGAELGVHKGYFSPVLLDRLAPEKLYLIDPWYLQGKQWAWGEGNRRAVDALCRILRELEDELAAGKAVLWIEDDLVALTRMPDQNLDWAYLDTTHQYDQTVRELRLLKLKIKPGGIIAGDDCSLMPRIDTMAFARRCENLWIASSTRSFTRTRFPCSGSCASPDLQNQVKFELDAIVVWP